MTDSDTVIDRLRSGGTGTVLTDASRDRLDAGRLGRFLGTLVALVAVFVAVSRGTEIDLLVLAPAYMFTPVLAGLAAVLPAEPSLRSIGVRVGRFRWAAIAAQAVLPITAATVVVSVAVPGVGIDPAPEALADLGVPGGVAGLVVVLFVGGVTANAVLAAGEELGWRGYLLWELAPLGFWRASALIGALWGVWHVPVILAGHNFPSFPVVGSVLFVGFCVAAAPLYTFVVVRGESVLPAVLLHGVFNGVAGTLVVSYTTADSTALAELVAHPGGVAGIVVAGLIALGIATTATPDLSRAFAGESP